MSYGKREKSGIYNYTINCYAIIKNENPSKHLCFHVYPFFLCLKTIRQKNVFFRSLFC